MNDFVSIEILSTIGGCSLVITLFTQAFKEFLPKNIDPKWLALVFSIIIGVLRIIYVGQFGFAGIVSGIFNIVILLGTSVGLYEVGKSVIGSKKEDDDGEFDQ